MTKRIRDTIHGYTYLTRLEEVISQHRFVLRLHFIHQTSFTYLTYPNSHSTRYPHSLGVMHVAGEIFRFALNNTKDDVLIQLATDVGTTCANLGIDVSAIAKEIASQPGSQILDEGIYNSILRPPHRQIFPASDLGPENVPLHILLLFQSVRLAALLHDIGHPPFSHIVEYGLREALSSAYPGHEKVGYALVQEIIRDANLRNRSVFSTAPKFCDACLRLSSALLQSNEHSRLEGIKKTLLSGEVDADRLDYVLRDAYSAGLVFRYDMTRLIEGAFFHKNQGDGKLEIAYEPKGLSALEAFFVARYDLYRWMIYHHDVVRRNLSIQALIKTILDADIKWRSSIAEIAADLREKSVAKEGHLEHYSRFVDSYLLDMLWRLDECLSDKEGNDSENDHQLRLYLDVLLRRRNDKLRTLIKRPDQYGEFAKQIGLPKQKGRSPRQPDSPIWRFNHLLAEKFKMYTKKQERHVARFVFSAAISSCIDDELAADGYGTAKVYSYYLGSFNASPAEGFCLFDLATGQNISVHDISPTLAMLKQAWEFSPQLLIFFEWKQDGGGFDMTYVRDNIRRSAANALKKFLN